MEILSNAIGQELLGALIGVVLTSISGMIALVLNQKLKGKWLDDWRPIIQLMLKALDRALVLNPKLGAKGVYTVVLEVLNKVFGAGEVHPEVVEKLIRTVMSLFSPAIFAEQLKFARDVGTLDGEPSDVTVDAVLRDELDAEIEDFKAKQQPLLKKLSASSLGAPLSIGGDK